MQRHLKPMGSWRRSLSCLHNVWLDNVQEDCWCYIASYAVIGDCQGSQSGTTGHSDYATTMMMMWGLDDDVLCRLPCRLGIGMKCAGTCTRVQTKPRNPCKTQNTQKNLVHCTAVVKNYSQKLALLKPMAV